MSNLQGTVVFGSVVPYSTQDIYSTHQAVYGKGGFRTVYDLHERNNITSDRREDLMLVAVEDNSFNYSSAGVAFYILDINNNSSTSTSLLDNNNWILMNFGYGADGWILPPPSQSTFKGNKGQRSYDDRYLYLCVEQNQWKRVEVDFFVNSGSSGFGGTSGFAIGSVPVWGFDNQWDYEFLIKDINTVQSNTSGNLLVTFTDNSTKLLDIGGDRWILPPPLSSIWVGKTGDRSYDSNYFYVCIQDNLWKRSAYDFFMFGGSTSGGGGSFFSLPNGYVPIWDSTLSNWVFNKVVSEVVYNSHNNKLDIIHTNNSTSSYILNNSLSKLNDVIENNTTSGDILLFNGNKWVNTLFPGIKWILPKPSTSTSIGKKGDLSYDDNFIYVCIENNTWKRINIDYFIYSGSTSGAFNLPFGSIPMWTGHDFGTTIAITNIIPTTIGGNYGEKIIYSNGTSSFIPFGTAGSIKLNLSNLNDVSVNVTSSSGIGNILEWNGSNWINTINTSANNGLTLSSKNIKLGGLLTNNTVVDGTNFNFTIQSKNGNINLKSNGSGNILINNINYPKTDGSNGFVLTSNGLGVLSLQNPSPTMFIQTITQTLSGNGINPQSDISFISSSAGNIGTTIISPNTLKIGDIIKLKISGFINIVSDGTFTFTVKFGSTTIISINSILISHPKVNQLIDVTIEFIIRAIGTNGKIIGNGVMSVSNGNFATPTIAEFVMINDITINTTISQHVDFTVAWLAGFDGTLNSTVVYLKKEKNLLN